MADMACGHLLNTIKSVFAASVFVPIQLLVSQ